MTLGSSSLRRERPADGSADLEAFETVFWRGGGAIEILLFSNRISVLKENINTNYRIK